MNVKKEKPISIDREIVKLDNEYESQKAIDIAKRIVTDATVFKKITFKRALYLLHKLQKVVDKYEKTEE